jgi:DNA polymerase-3 subunit delta
MAQLKPVYLISGSDRPKIRLALERLRNHFEEGAVEVLGADEHPAEDAVAACNALGLFGGEGRLVIVEDVDAWKVLLYDAPRKRDLPAWVAKQFEQHRASADRDASRLLVEMVGDDPERLRSEIEKLATWAGGESVTEDDVRLLASTSAETSVFMLSDAWGKRDVGAALAAVESLLERSGSRELPRLAALLANHVARVRACQALAEEGVAPRDAAGRLKMHPFAAEKAFAQAGNYAPDELAHALVRLAELDLALKGNSRLSGELELERALVEVTPAAS